MHTLLLSLHILGVAIWLGSNIVLAFTGTMSTPENIEARIWWAQTQGKMFRILYNAAAVLILITGILMLVVEDSPYSFSSVFVSVGFVAIIVGAGLGMAVFGPSSRELVAALKSGDESLAAKVTNRISAFGMLDTIVVLTTVFFMVAKVGQSAGQ